MPIKLNGSGSGSVALNAPANTSGGSDISFTLPTADGTSGQVLQTNGSGALSFASASSDNITEGNTTAEVVDTGSNGHFKVTTEGTEALRVDASQRLLVGTSSTSAFDNNVNIVSNFTHENTSRSWSSFISHNNANAAGSTLFFGRSRAASVGGRTIVNSGDGLGRISFQGADGGTEFVGAAEIFAEVDGTPGTNDMPGRLVFSTTADGSASPTERMRIRQNGRMIVGNGFDTNYVGQITAASYNNTGTYVSIGPTSDLPAENIYSRHAADTTYTHISFVNANGSRGSITTNASSTTYNTTSDYRLKENVVPLIGAIDRVNQLQVHRFNFIVDPDHTVDGFLAHEAQAVVPECVTGEKDAVDENGDPIYQGIDQSKLVPLLTAALQEALAKLETLEAANAALEARLTALEGGAS